MHVGQPAYLKDPLVANLLITYTQVRSTMALLFKQQCLVFKSYFSSCLWKTGRHPIIQTAHAPINHM